MKRKNPKWTHEFLDRHGKARYFLRLPGRKQMPLPGLPWSPEFMAARERLMRPEQAEFGVSRTRPGSVSAALVSYYASVAFSELAEGTRKGRRQALERFREKSGHLKVAEMPREALQRVLSNLKPNSARNWKKALRGFLDYCMAQGMLSTDPLAGVKLKRPKKTGGFHAWTEDEIAQYEARHAPGTMARLALALLLNTGHARADVVRMGRRQIKSGKLSMTRQKTGVQFDIPILPALAAELERHPATISTFLLTGQGRPFSAAGFSIWFRKRCNEAGLPQECSAHGLRKASAIRHALNDATVFELMAWHGWKTIQEAQRYVDEANRIKLAESSGEKVSRTSIGKPEV